MTRQFTSAGQILAGWLLIATALFAQTDPDIIILPGAPEFSADLTASLQQALTAKQQDPAFKPRSRHLHPDGSPKFSNRLLLQSSPYLQQHAHNPINWYSWGDEAFAAAKQLNRPVLLSIGYSTCHWCHVMEEESFEDLEIAAFLNQNYIAIKVDREERPDIDSIYMKAAQILKGRGGWPLTVWLLADTTPFYADTYIPARDGDRGVATGFLTFLRAISQNYQTRSAEIIEFGKQISDAIKANSQASTGSEIPKVELLAEVAAFYQEQFDTFYGGMDGAPKFPSSLPIRLLLRQYRRSGDEKLLDMATLTLSKMAAGGIHDQLGGGFHRYTVDAQWLTPHFEKMLYDNARLTLAYLEGYQASGQAEFAAVVRHTLDYVKREMTSPEGGFYSATDADSLNPAGHREEGWFFTWTAEEVAAAVEPDLANVFTTYYGITAAGNFEGRTILSVNHSQADIAKALEMSVEVFQTKLAQASAKLYAVRAERPWPLRDEKILTAWNGLMISAFASAGLVLNDTAYIDQAKRAADFILNNMRQDDGRLLRSYRDGKAYRAAYLDDYAFLIAGLLDLFEASSEARWLREAFALQTLLDAHYQDPNGGYFLTSADHEALLVREKPAYDGSEPNGNSIALLNLLRLAELTTDDHYRAAAERLLTSFGDRLQTAPSALSVMLMGLDFRHDQAKEIVIVVPKRAQAEIFLRELRQTFLPNRVLVVAEEGEQLAELSELIPLLAGKKALGDKPTAYVCEQAVCKLPTVDPKVFVEQIKSSQ